MIQATVIPELATGIAEKVADTLGAVRVEELSEDDVSVAIAACSFMKTLFSKARQSIENALYEGVDARSFAAKYERAIVVLDRVAEAVGRVAEKAQATHPTPLAQEFISAYEALGGDLVDLRQFLVVAVAKAKASMRQIDLNRVQEAEARYDRGETRPFSEGSAPRGAR